jgi:hypothetical protein
MNKEQQELLVEAYKNYVNNRPSQFYGPYYTQEEFINKCKTDTEFSEKWGLKIEERELSHKERYDEYNKIYQDRCTADCYTKEDFDDKGIPTKLITITYNNETIESYG